MVAFGRDFPLGLARQVMMTLEEFSSSEECKESLCATDFYGWTGLLPAEEQIFAPVEFVQQTLELSAGDMLELLHYDTMCGTAAAPPSSSENLLKAGF
jgi:hypothetical protein